MVYVCCYLYSRDSIFSMSDGLCIVKRGGTTCYFFIFHLLEYQWQSRGVVWVAVVTPSYSLVTPFAIVHSQL